MNLANYAKVLILNLTLPGIPGVQVKDKKRTDSVTAEAGTTAKHGRVTKTLFAESERAAKVRKLAQDIRSWIVKITLPGGGEGRYLVPLEIYSHVRQELQKRIADYSAALADFRDNLAGEIAADMQNKSGLASRDDYPRPADLANLAATFGFSPMATGDRFAELFDCDTMAAELAAEFERNQAAFLADAANTNRCRFLDTVTEQTAKLADYHAKPEGKRLHTESTWTTLSSASTLAKSLNFAQDTELATMADGVLAALAALHSHERMRDAINRQTLLDDIRKAIAPATGTGTGNNSSDDSEQPPLPEVPEIEVPALAEIEV